MFRALRENAHRGPWANKPMLNVATTSIFYDRGGVLDGGSRTKVDVGAGGIRFRTDDFADTIDDTNPLPIPSGSPKRSFFVHLYMQVTGGTFTQIDNVKFYTSGVNLYGDGQVDLFVGNETPINNSSGADFDYDPATGTVGDDGNPMVANHTYLTLARQDAEGFDSSGPKDISISEPGAELNDIGETTDYLVAQVEITSTATSGLKSAETLTWRHDET